METVVSGIRPTGNMHLGNYFGAVKNFLTMQHEANCFFFVADYHSLTTHPHPDNLNASVRQIISEYIACGLDTEIATLYVQSDLPETAELYLMLNMLSYVGELERSASFKEKIRTNPDNVNAGLLTYPVLMAADILIHKAFKVPVGKDQEQHLEMTRNFASRFNHLYKTDFFPQPVAYNFGAQLVKVPGLDGSGKMGKSEGEGNAIFFIDEPETIKKKVMRAVTDTGPTHPNQPKTEAIENIFLLMNLVSAAATVQHFETEYNNCTIRYGDMKKQLADDINNFVSPIREKIKSIASDHVFLNKVVKNGAEKARISGRKTIAEARNIIGIRNFI